MTRAELFRRSLPGYRKVWNPQNPRPPVQGIRRFFPVLKEFKHD